MKRSREIAEFFSGFEPGATIASGLRLWAGEATGVLDEIS